MSNCKKCGAYIGADYEDDWDYDGLCRDCFSNSLLEKQKYKYYQYCVNCGEKIYYKTAGEGLRKIPICEECKKTRVIDYGKKRNKI